MKCPDLETVHIPGSVRMIDKFAFAGNVGLRRVVFYDPDPESVIDGSAFALPYTERVYEYDGKEYTDVESLLKDRSMD